MLSDSVAVFIRELQRKILKKNLRVFDQKQYQSASSSHSSLSSCCWVGLITEALYYNREYFRFFTSCFPTYPPLAMSKWSFYRKFLSWSSDDHNLIIQWSSDDHNLIIQWPFSPELASWSNLLQSIRFPNLPKSKTNRKIILETEFWMFTWRKSIRLSSFLFNVDFWSDKKCIRLWLSIG